MSEEWEKRKVKHTGSATERYLVQLLNPCALPSHATVFFFLTKLECSKVPPK